MSKVDPFLVPIPQKILNDPDLRPFFEYFIRWAHDIWVRTGGGSDAIESQSIRESYSWDLTNPELDIPSTFFNAYQYLPEKILTPVSTSVNYTGSSNEFIKASSRATITFPASPVEGDLFVVKNADGSTIKLNGNNRLINGSLTGNIRKKNTSIVFYYFLNDNSWEAT